jgi:hypothetical protein
MALALTLSGRKAQPLSRFWPLALVQWAGSVREKGARRPLKTISDKNDCGGLWAVVGNETPLSKGVHASSTLAEFVQGG